LAGVVEARPSFIDQSRMLLMASESAADPIDAAVLSCHAMCDEPRRGANARMTNYARGIDHFAIIRQRFRHSCTHLCIGSSSFVREMHISSVTVQDDRR
jgi:hypothetical protein